jgi:hypothetical protein
MTIATNLQIEELTGYQVGESGILTGAPCCCSVCNTGVHPGHFACEQPTYELLAAEAEGLIVRHLMGVWCWYAA